mmetsp:Transcript_33329/g.67261  ORF Transcript_33329/g.67261 Transcript_33329/m.67261 type:complete len:106 (-) Transcript_33329:78-395(-)
MAGIHLCSLGPSCCLFVSSLRQHAIAMMQKADAGGQICDAVAMCEVRKSEVRNAVVYGLQYGPRSYSVYVTLSTDDYPNKGDLGAISGPFASRRLRSSAPPLLRT